MAALGRTCSTGHGLSARAFLHPRSVRTPAGTAAIADRTRGPTQTADRPAPRVTAASPTQPARATRRPAASISARAEPAAAATRRRKPGQCRRKKAAVPLAAHRTAHAVHAAPSPRVRARAARSDAASMAAPAAMAASSPGVARTSVHTWGQCRRVKRPVRRPAARASRDRARRPRPHALRRARTQTSAVATTIRHPLSAVGERPFPPSWPPSRAPSEGRASSCARACSSSWFSPVLTGKGAGPPGGLPDHLMAYGRWPARTGHNPKRARPTHLTQRRHIVAVVVALTGRP